MIRLDSLTKRFSAEGALALDAVSLTVAEGEFRVVVGASGSGKTTLVKMINRLMEPDAGSVYVNGVSAADEPAPALRRRIGYVFQGVGLFPHLTVEENIGVTPRLLGWNAAAIRARSLELLDLVDLPRSFASRRPDALSGGQRQRVGLARALAARPAVMLLDEPFGALDAVTRDGLGRAYRRIHDEMGLTTVMITHDMMEALLLADRIAVMRSGRIVFEGLPEETVSSLAPDYVRALVETPRRQADEVAALVARSQL